MRPVVDQNLCIACGGCEVTCPAQPSVFSVDGVSRVVHPEGCNGCNACVEGCPAGALSLVESPDRREGA